MRQFRVANLYDAWIELLPSKSPKQAQSPIILLVNMRHGKYANDKVSSMLNTVTHMWFTGMFYHLTGSSRKTNFTTRQDVKQTNSTKEYALNNIIEPACWLRDPNRNEYDIITIIVPTPSVRNARATFETCPQNQTMYSLGFFKYHFRIFLVYYIYVYRVCANFTKQHAKTSVIYFTPIMDLGMDSRFRFIWIW